MYLSCMHVDILDRQASSSSIVNMFLSCVKFMPAASTQCGTVDVNNLDTTDDLEFRDSCPPRAPLFNIGREWNVFEGSPHNIKEGGTGCPRTGFANVVLVRGPRIIDLCLPLPDPMAEHRKNLVSQEPRNVYNLACVHACMHVRVYGKNAFCMLFAGALNSALTVPR